MRDDGPAKCEGRGANGSRTRLVSAKKIFAAALMVTACRSSGCHSEQTRDVALGWRGSVDDFFASCTFTPVAASPTKVVASGSEYEAVAVGTEDFACDGDVIHVRVAPIARFVIDFPATVVVGERHPLLIRGDDGSGHVLDLGHAPYMATPGGVLEPAGCNDMDFLCGVGGQPLIARTPGYGSVTVSFRALTTTYAVVAVAPADAGAD
jgi:hypothetical protein